MKYADEFEEQKMDFQEMTMTNDEDEKEGENHDMKEEDKFEEKDETLEEDKNSKKLRPGILAFKPDLIDKLNFFLQWPGISIFNLGFRIAQKSTGGKYFYIHLHENLFFSPEARSVF